MWLGNISLKPDQKLLPDGAGSSGDHEMDRQCPKGGIFLIIPRPLGNHAPKHIGNMVAFKILPQTIG